jgi:hypothetical protein
VAGNFTFSPTEVYCRRIDGMAERVIIVFSPQQANDCMYASDQRSLLLCVDLPRSRLCASVAQAVEFFREGGVYAG